MEKKMKLEVEAKLKLASISQQIFAFVRLYSFHSTEVDRRKMAPNWGEMLSSENISWK